MVNPAEIETQRTAAVYADACARWYRAAEVKDVAGTLKWGGLVRALEACYSEVIQNIGRGARANAETPRDGGVREARGPSSWHSDEFDAGVNHIEGLLAKLLGVSSYEPGDGSEDFDNDATMTLVNILAGAGLWDKDENRPLAALSAPGSAGPGETVAIPTGEERDFWLEAAEQHGFTGPDESGECWLASEDALLKLMAAAREQGRKDVLASPHPAREPNTGGTGERIRHVKRGTGYEVLGEAEAQVSGSTCPDGIGNGVLPKSRILREGRAGYESDRLTVYRCETTGKLYCSFTDEFRDGRFETITPATSAETRGPAEGAR